MSVLKKHRHESKTLFLQKAYDIQNEVMNFLTRLSARNQRLLAPEVMRLSSGLVSYASAADDAVPTDDVRKNAREENLVHARGFLSALDIQLSICYSNMIKNPQGCFSKEGVSASEASERLDKMAQTIGTLIDEERSLLTGALKKL